MGSKTRILNKEDIAKAIERISHEIIEKNRDREAIGIIGIKKRGDIIAKRIFSRLKSLSDKEILYGALDITFYRDDLSHIAEQPLIHSTEIGFNIDGKAIILVDDVLYTGRTVRSALDALMDFGRPSKIELAVLIDRGHRELPIRADYVGKNLPTARDEVVSVFLEETDEVEEVVLEDRDVQMD